MRIAQIVNTVLGLAAVLCLASTADAQSSAPSAPANFKYQIRGDSTQTQYMIRPMNDANNIPIQLVPVNPAEAAAAAQPKPEVAYFHLEFALKQLDNGKVISNRTFASDANTSGDQDQYGNPDRGSYRSDVVTADPSQSGMPQNRHDLKINIDWSHLRLAGAGAVAITVNTQLDGLVDPSMLPNLSSSSQQGQFDILAFFGKPTVVFSATGPTSRYSTQLEVTATPIHLDAKP